MDTLQMLEWQMESIEQAYAELEPALQVQHSQIVNAIVSLGGE